MNNIKFNSLEELYKRLIPAMETKVQELKLDGISYITVDDICQATKISIKRLNNLINPNTKTTIKIRELYYISYPF